MWNRSPIIRGLATLLLFITLEGVSLLFIANDSLFQKARINGIMMGIKGDVSGLSSDVRYFIGLWKVNDMLHQENIALKNKLDYLKSELGQRDTLFSVTADSTRPGFSYIPARIISNSTNKLQNFIILDKGSRHGVHKEMGVISALGVVGVVKEVTENYSYVISFLNTTQSISARISPSGAFGPLEWDGKSTNHAILSQIPQHIRFNMGDTVSTSGYSSIFPEGIPLGTAQSSTLKGGTHHMITVKLFQDFSSLHLVNIAVNLNIQEINNLKESNNNNEY